MKASINDNQIFDMISQALDAGKFGHALACAEKLKNQQLVPKQVLKCLDLLNKCDDNMAGIWRDYSKDILKSSSGEVLYSSITETKACDFSDFLHYFQRVGNGGMLRIDKYVEFVTLGSGNCAVKHESLPQSNLTINLFLSFPSNVNENFYVLLIGDEAIESFRFSNSYISCCEDGYTINKDLRVDRLVTISTEEEYICVYIDGMLARKKHTANKLRFTELLIQLVGSPGADLAGLVKGLEIWSTKTAFKGFTDQQDIIMHNKLNDLVLQKNISDLHSLIKFIDGLNIVGNVDSICELLTEELSNRGYRDWIFDDILGKLPQDKAELWHEQNKDKIPQPSLSVENLQVQFYRIPNKRFTVKALFNRGIEKFNVLEDINFKLYPGDIMGIIGANGAGKSTLLKTIAGLVPVTKGRILLNGWHMLVSPGLGVRNELTGRENIYLSGCFLGLSKGEIDKLFESIVEFSELQDAIDKPFKFYSDGMKSRLIFSLATSVAPEILMLDELLSAGDIKFQKKAAQRMDELIEKAKVVVVVTHSVPFVAQKCNKAVLISKGKEVIYGDPKVVISYYLNELHITPNECTDDNPNNLSLTQQLNQQFSMASTGGR